jgi:hypothetical protein
MTVSPARASRQRPAPVLAAARVRVVAGGLGGLAAAVDSRDPRVAVAAYLSRFKTLSRVRAESDLRAFLTWCAERRSIRWPRPDQTSSCTCG